MDVQSKLGALIPSILEGAFETPQWTSFLAQLRELTGAEHATLFFRPPGRPVADAQHLYSGILPRSRIEETYDRNRHTLEMLEEFEATEGRVYAFGELYPPRVPSRMQFYENVIVPSGITASRLIRVTEISGVSALLTIARAGDDFTEDETELFKAIAPALRGALRNYAVLERERFAAALTGDAMHRLYFSWMTLDEAGRLVDVEAEAERAFALTSVLHRSASGNLLVAPRQLHSAVMKAVLTMSRNPEERPRAFTLSRDPWLDMLLMPIGRSSISASSRAAVVAYIHGDSWLGADRCDQLRQLFDLTNAEARLALELSQGLNLKEAASKFELQVGTVRKYSKSIYAKTGARGLPDLVRIVLRSVLSIAPDRASDRNSRDLTL